MSSGIVDLGELRMLQIERRLLAGCRVVVFERDIALPFGIEKGGVGIERAGLLGKIGEGIALQHGRDAVDLVLVADEVETGLALAEELLDVLVLRPSSASLAVSIVFDEIVVDERLLHAADDVDHVIAGRAAAGDQSV